MYIVTYRCFTGPFSGTKIFESKEHLKEESGPWNQELIDNWDNAGVLELLAHNGEVSALVDFYESEKSEQITVTMSRHQILRLLEGFCGNFNNTASTNVSNDDLTRILKTLQSYDSTLGRCHGDRSEQSAIIQVLEKENKLCRQIINECREKLTTFQLSINELITE